MTKMGKVNEPAIHRIKKKLKMINKHMKSIKPY